MRWNGRIDLLRWRSVSCSSGRILTPHHRSAEAHPCARCSIFVFFLFSFYRGVMLWLARCAVERNNSMESLQRRNYVSTWVSS
jgi:hypothetical protein